MIFNSINSFSSGGGYEMKYSAINSDE